MKKSLGDPRLVARARTPRRHASLRTLHGKGVAARWRNVVAPVAGPQQVGQAIPGDRACGVLPAGPRSSMRGEARYFLYPLALMGIWAAPDAGE